MIINVNLSAQKEMGFKVAIGYSIIEDDPEPGSDFYTEKIAPSFNIGYVSNINITKKLIIGSSFELNSILSKETYYPNVEVNRYIHYLSLPLTIELNLSNFQIGIGIRNSLRLLGGGRNQQIEVINGEEVKRTTKLKSSEYRYHDWGPIIKLDYKIAKKVKVSWFYYRGFANIHSNESVRSRVKAWKARQMVLGITYSIDRK